MTDKISKYLFERNKLLALYTLESDPIQKEKFDRLIEELDMDHIKACTVTQEELNFWH